MFLPSNLISKFEQKSCLCHEMRTENVNALLFVMNSKKNIVFLIVKS